MRVENRPCERMFEWRLAKAVSAFLLMLFLHSGCQEPSDYRTTPTPTPTSSVNLRTLVREPGTPSSDWSDRLESFRLSGRRVEAEILEWDGSDLPVVRVKYFLKKNEFLNKTLGEHKQTLANQMWHMNRFRDEFSAVELGIWNHSEARIKRDVYGQVVEEEPAHDYSLYQAIYSTDALKKINRAHFDVTNVLEAADGTFSVVNTTDDDSPAVRI